MDRLRGAIQHYDWGDSSFIAELQSRPASGVPEAELWLGAHPQAPSVLERSGRSLLETISGDPEATLGREVATTFGELPFLLKVLAAAQPLSIQAHPSRRQARVGFDRENEAGLPQGAGTRVYRDANHKPELICALTPFEAKCGFRPLDDARELFDELGAAFAPVRERLGATGPDAEVLHGVLAWLLGVGGADAFALVDAAVAAADTTLAEHRREVAWSAEIARHHPGDIGVVVVLLLNHVTLEPGDALFLGAGNLHAYLRGCGVEVMANSDNVVRGGLTTKHVDVDELLSIVDCTPVVPPVQRPQRSTGRFEAPVADFDLERQVVSEPTTIGVAGPEIVLVTDGEVVAQSLESSRQGEASEQGIALPRGSSLWVPADTLSYELDGRGTIFRCTVGALPE